MRGAADMLGRVWPISKLDDLLCDLGVQQAVVAAENVGGYDPGGAGRFDPEKVWAWATKQGRSQPGIALLLLLCWRSACIDAGAGQ